MKLPLQIVFRNIKPCDTVEACIREEFDWLETDCDKIISCRVSVGQPHRHRHQGKLFQIRVDLKVPDRELIVSRDHDERREREDIYAAIRDAFTAMQRQLQNYIERRRAGVALSGVNAIRRSS